MYNKGFKYTFCIICITGSLKLKKKFKNLILIVKYFISHAGVNSSNHEFLRNDNKIKVFPTALFSNGSVTCCKHGHMLRKH